MMSSPTVYQGSMPFTMRAELAVYCQFIVATKKKEKKVQ